MLGLGSLCGRGSFGGSARAGFGGALASLALGGWGASARPGVEPIRSTTFTSLHEATGARGWRNTPGLWHALSVVGHSGWRHPESPRVASPPGGVACGDSFLAVRRVCSTCRCRGGRSQGRAQGQGQEHGQEQGQEQGRSRGRDSRRIRRRAQPPDHGTPRRLPRATNGRAREARRKPKQDKQGQRPSQGSKAKGRAPPMKQGQRPSNQARPKAERRPPASSGVQEEPTAPQTPAQTQPRRSQARRTPGERVQPPR
jgi:hypothetical protein